MTNVAVFASGSGSNAVNLVKTFNAGNRVRVALCLTDREHAPVIEKMRNLGVETIYFPRSVWKENPQAILETLRQHDIKVIALAGFLCIINSEIVDAFEGRILNIHPSLLPAYGGMGMHGANVHKAVIDAGETKSGATVHIVTNEVDCGPIVVQREVPVLPDDTPESLEAKVHEVEYIIFPEAVVKTVASLTNSSDAQTPPNIPASSEEIKDIPVVTHPEVVKDIPIDTPPEVPKSVDDAWAEALGIPNNVPPNIPTTQQPNSSTTQQLNYLTTQQINYPTTQQPNNPTTQQLNHPAPIMPPTYLVWSVIMTILCCFIPGIVAIIYSAQVSSKFYQGDFDGALRASERAQIWIIVSFVLGVLTNTLYLPLMIAGGF